MADPFQNVNFDRIRQNARRLDECSASGEAANFECGSVVRFEILEKDGRIDDAGFTSTGCSYMLGAAAAVAEGLKGAELIQLHLAAAEGHLDQLLAGLGEPPFGRSACISSVGRAVALTFSALRAAKASEYQGDSPLICSCFGIDQQTIEDHIRNLDLRSIEAVTASTRAGSGCGSCRWLIQEMLDVDML